MLIIQQGCARGDIQQQILNQIYRYIYGYILCNDIWNCVLDHRDSCENVLVHCTFHENWITCTPESALLLTEELSVIFQNKILNYQWRPHTVQRKVTFIRIHTRQLIPKVATQHWMIKIHFIPIIRTDSLFLGVQETLTICCFISIFCRAASTFSWLI